jgi:hypothetical protein
VSRELDGLYRVSADTSGGPVVYGLVVEDGRVVRCAPYARKWALGREIRDVVAWLRAAMYWRVEWLDRPERAGATEEVNR